MVCGMSMAWILACFSPMLAWRVLAVGVRLLCLREAICMTANISVSISVIIRIPLSTAYSTCGKCCTDHHAPRIRCPNTAAVRRSAQMLYPITFGLFTPPEIWRHNSPNLLIQVEPDRSIPCGSLHYQEFWINLRGVLLIKSRHAVRVNGQRICVSASPWGTFP